MNISKTRKPLITQVDTKFVVSITLERKPLLLSVEHKQKLKEVRVTRLEKQLKSNILKRKKASKKNNG